MSQRSEKSLKKIKVAVLYGGRSAEHEVSLQSATNVIKNLDANLFEVIPIGIDKQGYWHLGQDVFQSSLEFKNVTKLQHQPTWFTPEWIGCSQIKELTASKELLHFSKDNPAFDVIFPVVHGPLCEDGSLQGLLELAGVPYVGCGVLSSALGMDKDVSKRLIMQAGFPVAPYLAFKDNEWTIDQINLIEKIANQLSFPVFVKPANTGSSVGITKVKSKADLQVAIDFALQFDTKILVEQALEQIMELELAVLEPLANEKDPIVSVVGHIQPHHEFYSYDAKYNDENGASLHIPAKVSEAVAQAAKEMASEIFKCLECEGMARVDLFFEQATQKLYFNEVNTIPGFTQISMYPKLMAASGMPYSQLLTHLVFLSMKRHKRRKELKRSYND